MSNSSALSIDGWLILARRLAKEALRRNVADPTAADIQMLLDPGVSPPGITINNGEAATQPSGFA